MLTITELKSLQKKLFQKEKSGQLIDWRGEFTKYFDELNGYLRLKMTEIIQQYENKGIIIECHCKLRGNNWGEIKTNNWEPHFLILSIKCKNTNKIWHWNNKYEWFRESINYNDYRTIYNIEKIPLPLSKNELQNVLTQLNELTNSEVIVKFLDVYVLEKYVDDLMFIDFENFKLLLGKEAKLLEQGKIGCKFDDINKHVSVKNFYDSYMIVEFKQEIHILYSCWLGDNEDLLNQILNQSLEQLKENVQRSYEKHIKPRDIKHLEYFFKFCEENNMFLREKWEQRILESWKITNLHQLQ